jgi:hypothetical protein
MRQAWHVACMKIREIYRATKLQSKHLKGVDYFGDLNVEGDNIKIDLKEIECENVEYIHLSQVATSDGLF